jgi:peptide/nickel transport system substrate-binding protein/oligopeptide transport system substrate-binding protein
VFRASAALAAATCLLLAACTAGDDPAAGPDAVATASPGETTEDPGDGTPEPDVTPTEPSLESGDAVLNVAIPDPATLDPMLLGDPGSILVARQLYEGLTAWDQERGEVVPAAAESWDVEKGGARFVFHLRDGIRFHDGTPVTASDFRYAFDRIAQKRNASDLAYTLELVKGFDAVNRFGVGDGLRGLKTPDDATLVIELSEPFYEFPVVLTHPGLVPLPEKQVRDLDSFLKEPVGNGPFKIARPWQPGGSVVLEASDSFYEPPALDGVQFVPFADAAESWIPFGDGDIDVAEVPVGQVQTAADAYGTRGYTQFLTGYYYAFNLDAGRLRDRRVRKAIALAIDKRRIAGRIYKGNMEPLDGVVPPGMPGFEGNGCSDPCRPNLAAARRMVRKLPKAARSIPLEFTSGQPHTRVAASVARDLRKVGFNVKVRSFAFSKYLKRLSEGKQGFYRLGWIAEYPSPDVFLGPLFGSDSPDNHTGFRSKRFDRLIEKAHRVEDDSRRTVLYRKAERTLLRADVIVPIGSFINRWAARPEVEGIEFDVFGGFDAAEVTLDQDG